MSSLSQPPTAPAYTTSADDLRQQGNFQFSEENYEAAASLYTAALESLLNDNSISDDNDVDKTTQVVLNLCNRSACYYLTQDYEQARLDAQQAWDLSQHTSVKAAFRLAKAQGSLHQYEQAQSVIKQALQILQLENNNDNKTSNNNDNDNDGDKIKQQQKKALLDLQKQLTQAATVPAIDYSLETSIKTVTRPVSIKEFVKGKALGYGNFSEVHIVTHARTKEQFALKSIVKKQAADLAKRQHPNVYNEIQMERRVLLERVPPHQHLIRMYHAFQDYNTIYYLMDLHVVWSDLWSQTRYHIPTTTAAADSKNGTEVGNNSSSKYVMVGCHRSQIRVWIAQLIDAVEHLHQHGIVHRDLKPENILLNSRGHVVVIDLGTAKDLIETDLNGPEFVGTPDFMSPEAVSGNSSMEKSDQSSNNNIGATHAADLWAVGATLYLLETGQTPFWSPSPYLAFIRIQRGLLTRPTGIIDDDTWDLVQQLMKNNPSERLGADAYAVQQGAQRTMQKIRLEGYDVIRKHPYFCNITPSIKQQSPVPSLRDLCVRPVAELAYQDAHDLNIIDTHPPGDGSRHDMVRLSPRDRAAVLWVLDRQKHLQDERVWARFFTENDDVNRRLDSKIRPLTRDFVGLTQMNDDQGKPSKAVMNDPYAKPVALDTTIRFVQISNPLFNKQVNESCDEETRKQYIKLLKRCIVAVNKKRPQLVVAAGYLDEKCRKFLARISDSIPVVAHDGSHFFTFWLSGVQCIALQSNDSNDTAFNADSSQVKWMREQFELCRLSKHPLFIFCKDDPQLFPVRLQKLMARGRTLMLSGVSSPTQPSFEKPIKYHANEKVDDASVKSTGSDEDDADEFTMHIVGTTQNGLRWYTIEDEPDKWKAVFEEIALT